MAQFIKDLPLEEKIPLQLRRLYEQYGYKKYNMEKFEPYDLYRDNKNFLKGDGIITFTGGGGSLMALKPDVTMSIVKNAKDDHKTEKLYYVENIFRIDQGSHEYKEISQIGLEFLGGDRGYAEAETILLAIKSLEIISPSYILNIGHMGYINALFGYCGISVSNGNKILNLMRQKNTHELTALCDELGLSEEYSKTLLGVAGISTSLGSALPLLQQYAVTGEMKNIVAELATLNHILSSLNVGDRVIFDFSVIYYAEYYNGIVFKGYVEQIPSAVLTGGRYDNLMDRFHPGREALGFALYMGDLARFLYKKPSFDVDILLIYGNSDNALVAKTVADFVEGVGCSVRAEKEYDVAIKAEKIYRLNENGSLEVIERA